MDTLEEYEVYKAHKLDSCNILNDKLCFTTNALYDMCMREVYIHPVLKRMPDIQETLLNPSPDLRELQRHLKMAAVAAETRRGILYM